MSSMNAPADKLIESEFDIEKHTLSNPKEFGGEETRAEATQKPLWFRVLNSGVEAGGIAPVPVKDRKDTRIVNLFTVWFTMLLCLLP